MKYNMNIQIKKKLQTNQKYKYNTETNPNLGPTRRNW